MSGFNGINQFGNLTINGKKLNFEDFDKNGDGKISQEEYNSLLKEVKLDSVELSTVDKNGDKQVSQDEFALWEQKIQMQDAVNALSATISKDFAGKTKYLPELTEALRDYIEEFAATYKEDVSGMAEAFKETLPDKYRAIKASVLANDPSTIQSKVLDDIYNELISNTSRGGGLPDATAKRIAKELETEANKFAKTYSGNNYEADLKAHLNEYLNKSDADKLQSAATTFKNNISSFGALIDNGAELTQLKEYAKEFLTEALNAGVTVKLAGTTIKTTAAITTALKKFSDSETLKFAIEDIISGLDTKTLKEKLIQEEETKAISEENKKFTNIKGSEYAIDASLIDYSGIDGYFNNGEIYERGKGWSGSRDKAYEKGCEVLNSDTLKNQLKAQIKEMLSEKGIPFEKIEQVFENVYNSSVVETLNAEDMITGRGARGMSKKGKAHINIKNMVDTFITTFNTNIATAIDKMNASDKDFDTVDLNMSVLGKDENGKNIQTANNDDILKAYQTGTLLTTRKHGADYYVKIAEQIIDGLKSQMLTKAKNMCSANGVEFDMSKFNTMFNNAKGIAVSLAVSGVDSKGQNFGGTAATTAGGLAAGAGVVAASATTAAVVTGTTAIALPTATVGFATLGGGTALAPILGTAVATGPVGWIAGGALALGVGIAAAFGFSGHHSSSTLDTRALIDGFTEQFSNSFTQWVNAEKAEAKNKK